MKTSKLEWNLALVVLLSTAAAYGEPVASAREYCHTGGGTLQETGDPDMHICCYTARQRCLAVNERSRLSIRVVFPGEDGEKESGAGQDLR